MVGGWEESRIVAQIRKPRQFFFVSLVLTRMATFSQHCSVIYILLHSPHLQWHHIKHTLAVCAHNVLSCASSTRLGKPFTRHFTTHRWDQSIHCVAVFVSRSRIRDSSNRQPPCQVLQRVATQQSITHVIYSLYPCLSYTWTTEE